MFNINEVIKIKGTNLIGTIKSVSYLSDGSKSFTVFIPPDIYKDLSMDKIEKRYKKMSFRQFIKDIEKVDGDAPSDEWIENFLNDIIKEDYHNGDCTNHATPCSLCLLEDLLTEYRQYVFDMNSQNIDNIFLT